MSCEPPCSSESVTLDRSGVRRLAKLLVDRDQKLSRGSLPFAVENATHVLAADLTRIRGEQLFCSHEELEEVGRIQRDFRSRNGARLVARAEDGRVREGLGAPLRLCDLQEAEAGVTLRRLEHRRTGPARDVCLDTASLALDLRRVGRGDLAEHLLASFASAGNDFESYGVIGYYERECAVRRAACSPTASDARPWILLALATRRPPVLSPMLVAVGGLVASGKSTIARIVADHMEAPRIEADRARQQLLGENGLRTFAEGFEAVVYEELVRRAEIVLSSGRPVVLDACFPLREQRALARKLARERGWPFLFVECRVDPSVARARLCERNAASGQGDWIEIHRAVARRWETPDDLPREQRLSLDCARPLCESEACLFERIPRLPIDHELP